MGCQALERGGLAGPPVLSYFCCYFIGNALFVVDSSLICLFSLIGVLNLRNLETLALFPPAPAPCIETQKGEGCAWNQTEE